MRYDLGSIVRLHGREFEPSVPRVAGTSFMQRALVPLLIVLVWLLTVAGVTSTLPAAEPSKLSVVAPLDVKLDDKKLVEIEPLVMQAIGERKLPGCVIAIGRDSRIAYLRAFGNRALEPEVVPMTIDTVFDVASLTKPIATATCVMKLIESGRLKLSDRVSQHLPDFTSEGKDAITVEQLLIHQGGLIADNALADYQLGPETAWQRIAALKLTAPIGTKFIYSDVSFIVLGELVRRVSSKPLDEFAQQEIFKPLGMSESGYRPTAALKQRAAPTERRNGEWIKGDVHDPRAHLLGGVAGHAGLFSTIEDLARYAAMMANGGEYNGVRVLQEVTWREMTTAREVSSGKRGLGWDMKTGYSSNRGATMSERAFGHGGFTGTALWIDPETKLFVIFLSNRVHPNGKGLVNPLAGKIGTIAADAVMVVGQ